MTVNGQERDGKRWIRADFHIHTPASEDYAEPQSTFLDILREAERHDLEIIAFTDHNTVHGYEQMLREIDFLQTLEQAQRLTADEQEQLGEYRRLLDLLGDDSLRRVAVGKMEGFTNDEIAAQLDCSLRTVARKLETIGLIWGEEPEP